MIFDGSRVRYLLFSRTVKIRNLGIKHCGRIRECKA